MIRILLMVLAAAWIGIGTAYGQEAAVGAGRVEIAAFPGGGILFQESGKHDEPDFKGYVLGGALTYNFNRWVGLEAEVGASLAMKQSFTFRRQRLINQKPPSMLTYTGNVVLNPFGNDRSIVPYGTAGIGGLTVYNKTASDSVNLGFEKNESFLTANAGGGLKWFAARHVGLRVDYRFMAVQKQAAAPLFFGREDRFAHRLYGGLLLTY